MKVTLTGFMGSGKSCVGELLAFGLGLPFKDLDRSICSERGCSIPEIFAEGGEELFRRLELERLRALLDEGDAVIALGGGTLTIPEAGPLVDGTTCIFLDTGLDTITDRLGLSDPDRPLFRPEDPLFRDMFEERRRLYAAAAHITVTTDGRTPDEIVEEILQVL